MTVAVVGNPLPTAVTLQKWSTGAFVDYPSTRYFVNDLRTISIPNLFLNDSGRYRVCVESSHDSESVCDEFDIEITGSYSYIAQYLKGYNRPNVYVVIYLKLILCKPPCSVLVGRL